VAAGEVDHAVLREPAAAPDQEGVDRVDQTRPEDDERNPGLEVHATEHGAEDQDRRDRREDELEVDERGLREVEDAGVSEVRDLRLALEIRVAEHAARLADQVVPEAVAGAERDRV